MVYCFYDRWMTGLFLRWSWFSCELIVLYSIGCRMPKWIFCLMYMLVNPGDTRSGYIRRRLTFSGNGCPQASSILWDERSDLSVVCWVVTQVASFHFCLFYRVLQGLTIDVIGTCAFGLDPHFQKNTDDPFIVRCRRLFADFGKRPVLVVMGGKFSDSLCNHRWLGNDGIRSRIIRSLFPQS